MHAMKISLTKSEDTLTAPSSTINKRYELSNELIKLVNEETRNEWGNQ